MFPVLVLRLGSLFLFPVLVSLSRFPTLVPFVGPLSSLPVLVSCFVPVLVPCLGSLFSLPILVACLISPSSFLCLVPCFHSLPWSLFLDSPSWFPVFVPCLGSFSSLPAMIAGRIQRGSNLRPACARVVDEVLTRETFSSLLFPVFDPCFGSLSWFPACVPYLGSQFLLPVLVSCLASLGSPSWSSRAVIVALA